MSSSSVSSPSASGRLDDLLAEHADLEHQLADPAVHAEGGRARLLGRRYAELSQVAEAARAIQSTRGDLSAARELAGEDDTFAAEAGELATRLEELEGRLRELLVPRDPDDGKDAILEVKAGEGGEESALFAGDLLRMYLRYAERQGWSAEVLDSTESDLGGYKDVSVAIRARSGGVFGRLKYEGGVHRVQRVPVTESQGRLHTSVAGVLVLPEAEDVDVSIDPNDLRIDVFRSSGPGGQSVNTTDSAVRITHVPTNTVVSCQNEKSQLQNKESALRILRARLLAAARESAAADASAARFSQVRTVDRSERVRTYNYRENRISDHRVGYTAYNLDRVLDGELDSVLEVLMRADTDRMLAGETGNSGNSGNSGEDGP
jgi:peptide chain release factor 1